MYTRRSRYLCYAMSQKRKQIQFADATSIDRESVTVTSIISHDSSRTALIVGVQRCLDLKVPNRILNLKRLPESTVCREQRRGESEQHIKLPSYHNRPIF
jgi:hypothetical protein